MLLNLPKERIKFCLVGSGKVCAYFSELLLKNSFPPPVIVTWDKSKHARDIALLKGNKNYLNIFDFAKNNNIKIFESENVNSNKTINLLKKNKVNIIFSIKSRWIIKEDLINRFSGNVINIHQGYLPIDRGSVTYQKIMNKNNFAAATIHLVDKNIDSGDILYRKKQKLNILNPTIDDFNLANYEICKDLLVDFINDLSEKRKITQNSQKNDNSIYMPQFYTEINGAINWSWSAKEIDRFIRAFGNPMPGAFSYLNNKRIVIHESSIEKSKKKFHPYFNGRIVTILNDGSMRIITKKNYLIVKLISYKGFTGLPKNIIKLSSNSVLHTPNQILEKAKTNFTWSLKMKPPS